jgi:hypothetical protein
MQLSFSQLSRSPIVYLLLGAVFSFLLVVLVSGIIPSFDHRTIGIAVLHAQDVAVRGRVQVLAVLGGICFFLAFFLKLGARSQRCSHASVHPNQAVILGLVLAANFLLFIYTDKQVFMDMVYALLYLAGLGLFITYKSRDEDVTNIRWIIVALSYHVLITAYCISGQAPQFNLQFFALFTCLLPVTFLATRKTARIGEDAEKLVPLVRGLWPLMLLPSSVIFATEVQYSLFARYQLSVSDFWLWMAMAIVLSIIGLLIFLKLRKKIVVLGTVDVRQEINRVFFGRYLPLVLMTTVAFSGYTNGFDFFLFRDFFHGGEAIVPMQQLLQFGSIPYIDFYPPHGLFDMLPQTFYQAINQTPYAESHSWGDGYMSGWVPEMLAVLVVYWFLGEHLSYKATFLVLFALPTYHLIHPYYIALILPALMIGEQRKNFFQWMLYWSLLVVITLWRIDFGIAVLCASLFVLIMWAWSERSLSMLANSITALGVVGIATMLLFSILSISKGFFPFSVFQKILNYVTILVQVTSYETFLRQLDAAAFIQYLFLPLIGVVYTAYFTSRVIQHQRISRLHMVMAYLAVLSLVISVRSLNRHSHFEGSFSTYFYFLVLALAPLLFAKYSKTLQVALFIFVCVAGYAFLPSSKSYFQLSYYYLRGVEAQYPAPASKRAPILQGIEGLKNNRVGSTKSGAENTVLFLNQYLQGRQTFYDLTNSPLLYALAEKKLPSYTLETLFHTSEAMQNELLMDLDVLYQKDELPLVLFKQNNRWDEVDGVANEIRSYRIVEYIYKKFLPCVSVDNYEIWLSKDLVGTKNCANYVRQTWPQYKGLAKEIKASMQPLRITSQFFNLHKLPYVWANYDDLNPPGTMPEEQNLVVVRKYANPNLYELTLPESRYSENGNYIHLRIYSEIDTKAKLVYANGNGFSFDILAGPDERDYLIRISAQYAWHSQDFTSIELESASPIELVSAWLMQGD